jgi:hypothetical protein
MSGSGRIAALRYALIATGVIFTGGIATLARVWPSGWSWGLAASAVGDPAERWHLVGDVPALLVVVGALAFLTRPAVRTGTTNLGFRRVA